MTRITDPAGESAAGRTSEHVDGDGGHAVHDFAARAARGRMMRRTTPRSAHSGWDQEIARSDPVALLKEQESGRVPDLMPIRYERMKASPFSFYRGAALIMASDLAATPTTGITVQLCGDAHLSNFGLFGTPERRLVFDLNDFDETLPGPWEWDVKRLAASFEVACRARPLPRKKRRNVVRTVVRSYREEMRARSTLPIMTAWYERMDADAALDRIRKNGAGGHATTKEIRRADATVAAARNHTSALAYRRLVTLVDGRMMITPQPPLIIPVEDLDSAGRTGSRVSTEQFVRGLLESYSQTLTLRNHPVNDFTYAHMARKVVGVGSVGTRAWVILLRGRDDGDPLFLQAKEAQASVLERFLAPSEFADHGQRVVEGQRLMQSASDIFLGWQAVIDQDGHRRDYYIRQLYDLKGSIDVEHMTYAATLSYARMCGEALARAHARTGDRFAIAGYLGKGTQFDEAIADFSSRYADQNMRDYEAFTSSLHDGRLSPENPGTAEAATSSPGRVRQ